MVKKIRAVQYSIRRFQEIEKNAPKSEVKTEGERGGRRIQLNRGNGGWGSHRYFFLGYRALSFLAYGIQENKLRKTTKMKNVQAAPRTG